MIWTAWKNGKHSHNAGYGFRLSIEDRNQHFDPKWQTITIDLPHNDGLSSSHILHILDAAHIRPYTTEGGTHSPTNGILLRQDIHTLFDRGYITVTSDYHVEVSKRIKEEFNNGVEYYAMHGKQIHLPRLEQLRPSRESLSWHNETVFLKH